MIGQRDRVLPVPTVGRLGGPRRPSGPRSRVDDHWPRARADDHGQPGILVNLDRLVDSHGRVAGRLPVNRGGGGVDGSARRTGDRAAEVAPAARRRVRGAAVVPQHLRRRRVSLADDSSSRSISISIAVAASSDPRAGAQPPQFGRITRRATVVGHRVRRGSRCSPWRPVRHTTTVAVRVAPRYRGGRPRHFCAKRSPRRRTAAPHYCVPQRSHFRRPSVPGTVPFDRSRVGVPGCWNGCRRRARATTVVPRFPALGRCRRIIGTRTRATAAGS